MAKFAPPSAIHFTINNNEQQPEGNPLENKQEQELIECYKKTLANGDFLVLQVAENNGFLFALNDARLQIFRKLEAEGECSLVKLDIIPLSEIPEEVRKNMLVKDHLANGYRRLSPPAEEHHGIDSDDDVDNVDVSDHSTDTSDSDWSDDYVASSDSDYGTHRHRQRDFKDERDDGGSSGDEREALL
ncbi:uncharacterized protein LOC106177608 [Lingula anatina]|uniref:Uncharacterized protein LOC106177608 n=1 Tax=Lingula anatina TaxID=7574 RepID=A0A1S3JZS6_LINAN|nr:uncharacterized protein LOC106177608 [Lingula anatina]|eukprot:XP_013415895.1 uncharacterized protein LOC106177608 [Lingula anatina]